MIKFFAIFFSCLFIAGVGDLYASSVDYFSSQSIEALRSLNRNAVTDSADAVFSNPAGVVKLEDGFYINAGNMFIAKEYSAEDKDITHVFNTKTYKSENPSPLVPNIFLLYSQDDWAAFGSFNSVGGGQLEFRDGTPMIRTALYGVLTNYLSMNENEALMAVLNIDKLNTSTMYLGGTFGGAYAINDRISISLAGRFIYSTRKLKGDAKTADIKYTTADANIADVQLAAKGFGGIIGVNYAPNPELNIGARFETVTQLDYDTSINGSFAGLLIAYGLGYQDGKTEKKDLPALSGIGVEYKISPEIKTSVSFNYFFIEQAIWQHSSGTRHNVEYDNGWDAGISFEYRVMEALTTSIGYSHSDVGSNNKTLMDIEITPDSNSIACGVKYKVQPGLDINVGVNYIMFDDSTTKYPLSGNTQNIDYTKKAFAIGVGFEYKAM